MIRIIILLILLSSCNSVKRNVVRSTTYDSIAQSGITDSSNISKTVTNAAKYEQKDQTDYEIETSTNEFPKDADTSMEVIKIAKSLPKGSVIRVLKDKGHVITVTRTLQEDTAHKHIDTTSASKHESKIVQIHKESKRFPTIAAIGIVAVIGILLILFIKLPSLKTKLNEPNNHA